MRVCRPGAWGGRAGGIGRSARWPGRVRPAGGPPWWTRRDVFGNRPRARAARCRRGATSLGRRWSSGTSWRMWYSEAWRRWRLWCSRWGGV